ncbi:MAG TPA: PHB depolymerase family esterase, partial [Steroidobacteraceae bacterium]
MPAYHMCIEKAVRNSLAFGTLGLVLLAAAPSVQAEGEILRDIVFADYSERSSSAELARRMLSPLSMAQLERETTRSGKQMVEQSIKLSEEKFIVYVPSPRPARGFALLVFVPPWQDARLPPGWTAALDRYGVIFVSAARSGNNESVFDRREPLAILAAQNVVRRYAVDPERVYIGGFSGGARVALRLALAYPDVFHGAILNAGSDPIGDSQIPIPPKDLFLQFQSTHLVYVTGEGDTFQLSGDLASMHSMKSWCVFDVQGHVERSGSHEVADSTSLAWALGTLSHD